MLTGVEQRKLVVHYETVIESHLVHLLIFPILFIDLLTHRVLINHELEFTAGKQKIE